MVPHNKLRGKILLLYQKLTKDYESEVRIVAAKNLFSYSQSMKKNYDDQNLHENFKPVFQQSILPQLKRLLNDDIEEVRLAVASNLLNFASLLEKEFFKDDILPLITEILETETCMEIHESILHGLNQLPETVDLTQSLHSIKNVVRTLIVNSQSHWRTRRNLLLALTHISRFATKEFFSDNLKINYAALLGDPVFAVRRSAALILPLLAKQYSIEWTLENIIPYFTMFTKDVRYLYRYVPLFGIQELIKSSLSQQFNYLESFETLVRDSNESTHSKAKKAVVKVCKMKDKIEEKLNEQKCKDILSLNKNNYDFAATDKIEIYAEDILDNLKSCSNCNIFSVDEQSMRNDTCTYLEGILYLIYTKFLDVVIILFDDTIINIQIRSLFMLNEIKEFIERLGKELQQSWIQQIFTELTNNDHENIEQEINEIINRQQSEDMQEVKHEEQNDDNDQDVKSENKPEVVISKKCEDIVETKFEEASTSVNK